MEEQTQTFTQQAEAPQEALPGTAVVCDVRFRNNVKTYYFDPNGLTLQVGDAVIIDTARGAEYGVCTAGNHEVPQSEIVPPLRQVLRLANAADKHANLENQAKEKRAFDICLQKIADHKLEMQLVSCEYAFDGSKILFFFTADGRVDFRELVKDLASVFRTRIELRQIGVRDKAKIVGGLGICGRPFCCKEFLDDFQPVSIKMAKTQSLSLNPTKISGTCGRLMCCLKYEQEAYEDLIRNAPRVESFVDTPDGRGTVTEINLLRQSVKVRMENQPETIGCYKNCDICVLRSGKPRKNEPPIPSDLAPISSRPRQAPPAEDEFEPLPELVYADEVAEVTMPEETSAFDPEPDHNDAAVAAEAEEAGGPKQPEAEQPSASRPGKPYRRRGGKGRDRKEPRAPEGDRSKPDAAVEKSKQSRQQKERSRQESNHRQKSEGAAPAEAGQEARPKGEGSRRRFRGRRGPGKKDNTQQG